MGVQQINRFWHRRLCEASLLFAVLIVSLWAWHQLAGVNQYNAALDIPLFVVVMAGATSVVALTLYIRLLQRNLRPASQVVYLCTMITAGALIASTGGLESPFIVSWLIIAVFAMYFGWTTLAIVLMLVNAYLSWSFLTGHILTTALPGAVLTGDLPVLIGCLLWGPNDTDDEHATSYRELAARLSRIAGKSDVVLNAIDDGVLALNAHGVIELINPAARRIIGFGGDALGLEYQVILKLVDGKDDAVTDEDDPVAAVLAHNQPINTDRLRLITSAGKTPIISLVVLPVGEPGDGVIVVFRDITKAKAEERQQAEFISTASHEMRTPVASIEGYLGLALNPATATIDDRARKYVSKAHHSAEHLGRLFQDLLDVSKADDGRLHSAPQVIDLIPFVNDTVEGFRHKADTKQLQLIFTPHPGKKTAHATGSSQRTLNPAFYVYADRDQLREVLDNLIDNAIKYTPQGHITVDVTGGDGLVTVSITDTGIGIPIENQSHLFQKFYRVDSSDTREIGGTGLGLYLSRRLVELMKGRIRLDSAHKQGSTFYVELPRLSEQEAARIRAEQAEAAKQQAPHPKPLKRPPAFVGSPLVAGSPLRTPHTTQPIQPATVAKQTTQPIADITPVANTNPPQPSPATPGPLTTATTKLTQAPHAVAAHLTRPAPRMSDIMPRRRPTGPIR